MFFEILGILSAIIFLVGDFPYLTDTLKGKTKPQRVTWGVVFLLNIIGFSNQYASGADNSLWLFGAAVFATGLIFLASLRNGVGGYAKLDIFSIVASLIGIGLWIAFDSPLLSILTTVFVDVVALTPTFIKTRKAPETETNITWLLGTVSAIMATIAVGKLDFKLLVLPIVAAILQGYMVYILYFETRNKKKLA